MRLGGSMHIACGRIGRAARSMHCWYPMLDIVATTMYLECFEARKCRHVHTRRRYIAGYVYSNYKVLLQPYALNPMMLQYVCILASLQVQSQWHDGACKKHQYYIRKSLNHDDWLVLAKWNHPLAHDGRIKHSVFGCLQISRLGESVTLIGIVWSLRINWKRLGISLPISATY